ncbi:MAG TPA: toxin-antitoxin system HicB family antitoxin [Jatrophihabitans sp.]|jgi:hypothetical protein|uniref:toxin-antitoxin system HicB family antitoxin n=1 Tax=Jatrophihabitans sp. TaxID=1932789 RepID=UPI002E0C1222|nr:toxin-antitoxin system HicB family antitoxin [Jatrophihabitans sp.]
MHLDQHLVQVQDQLTAAAALGDDRTKDIAAALATAATPAVRLAVLDAVSAAADEITAALLDYPGSPAVTVRLDGDEIHIGVQPMAATAEAPGGEARRDDDASARISLRLSEALKTEVDEAAARDGVSVNTWLVRAATNALHPGPFGGLGAGLFGSGGPFGPGGFGGHSGPGSGHKRGEHGGRVTGWING